MPPVLPEFFEEAKRLVASAVAVAYSEEDALQIRGILGEVLRAKGDLDDAVSVLRGALVEEGWGEVCGNLAATFSESLLGRLECA